jgi:alpha-galactosidase
MDMGDHEIWAKPLAHGEVAVCFLNRTDKTWSLDYNWKKNIMYFVPAVNVNTKEYLIRDLWNHRDIGTTASNTKYTIPAHGVLMVRLSLKK